MLCHWECVFARSIGRPEQKHRLVLVLGMTCWWLEKGIGAASAEGVNHQSGLRLPEFKSLCTFDNSAAFYFDKMETCGGKELTDLPRRPEKGAIVQSRQKFSRRSQLQPFYPQPCYRVMHPYMVVACMSIGGVRE